MSEVRAQPQAESKGGGDSMCGIFGIYGYRSARPADPFLVRAMTATLLHRGPDDEGYHLDGSLGMGMRRLSIIDLEGGAQPIANELGDVVLVFNGEIYNFRDLRRELEGFGHAFRTRSDTETIVHAYEQWGVDALTRLNGMFGIAIWDARARRLLLARDPFGIKPLYFRDDGATLLFGSELRPILRYPGVTRELDAAAFDQYLDFRFVPSPRTAFAGISKLPPGHRLLCDRNGVRMERFHPTPSGPAEGRSEEDLAGELAERIRAAVERQLVADVPVGVMLSGGADSALVAALMVSIASAPVDSFTVGFGEAFDLDETAPARESSRRLGTRHHEVVISVEEFDALLPRSIGILEEPVATSSTLPFLKVCELASRSVKVALSGQGADEAFAGYPRYLGERYGGILRALPGPVLRGLVTPVVRRLPRSERLKRAARSLGSRDPLERLQRVCTILDPDLKTRLYPAGSATPGDGETSPVARWQTEVTGRDGLAQMLYLDARFSLPDNLLMYTDKMSMSASLEVRVPFLDLDLMAFAETIPSRFKVRRLVRKHILREAASRWLPPEVLARKKINFATPIDTWLRTDRLGDLESKLLGPDAACAGMLDARTLSGMIADHRRGRHDHSWALFALLVFEIWHETFIRSATPQLPDVPRTA